MSTVEEYEQFVCTESYYPFDGTYGYTDGVKYLEKHLDVDNFLDILCNIREQMSYKLPFGFFELHVEDDLIYLITQDGDGNKLCKNIITEEAKMMNCTLDNGVYKIWCQNYVIFAAREY